LTATFASTSIAPPSPSLATQDLTLKQVIQTIPKVYFQKDAFKAWRSVAISVIAVALGYAAIALSPWFLLPLAWFFTGTALTGFFVIGHDCGHRSFSNRRWLNNWLGHLMFLPLIYPFHSWRLLHDVHHRHTNNLDQDNAWTPWTAAEYEEASGFMKAVYRGMRGGLWWLASVAHWVVLHFNLQNFEPRDRSRVFRSIALVSVFALIFFPSLWLLAGPWGIVKYWLMPWLGYHFWMSTFTLVHHTVPEISFHHQSDWHETESQLAGTLHCDYPRWVELLCHDINVHVPHHISVGIPSYNLRPAYGALQKEWGPLIKQTRFSWGLMKQIISDCHLYHPDRGYQRFRDLDPQR
jgi:omega-6 fatty acid desaturase (delta-12 desaturase)